MDLEARIISVYLDGDLWKIQVEVLEEGEYLRQRARRDLLAEYAVTVGHDGEIKSFVRQEMRERGTVRETV